MINITDLLNGAIIEKAKDLKLRKLYRARWAIEDVFGITSSEKAPGVSGGLNDIKNQIVVLEKGLVSPDEVELEIIEIVKVMTDRAFDQVRQSVSYEMTDKQEKMLLEMMDEKHD